VDLGILQKSLLLEDHFPAFAGKRCTGAALVLGDHSSAGAIWVALLYRSREAECLLKAGCSEQIIP